MNKPRVIAIRFDRDAPAPAPGGNAGPEASYILEKPVLGAHGFDMHADFERGGVVGKRKDGTFFFVSFAAARFVQFAEDIDAPTATEPKKASK